MSSFAIRYPFFILMACLGIVVIGTVNLLSMPVDLFPAIKIPVVVVATFYSGMPPKQVEADITDTFERFFTLGSGIDHIESVSYTHLRAHETGRNLVCRLLLEKKKKKKSK